MKQNKHFFINIFWLLIILLIANKLNAQGEALKLYGIQSGIIEYKYSGSEVGKSILYFDNYGNRSAMNVDTKRDNEINKGWVISHGEYQYIFDPAKPNEGWKLKNPIIEWINQTGQKDVEKFTEETYSKMGIVKAGTEKFLDKDCIAYKGDMGNVLTWNGILMLLDLNFSGMKSRQEATSIKVNIPVDEKYFEIPKNIKFSDMPMFGTEGYDEDEDEE
jgi:hypothetical protein